MKHAIPHNLAPEAARNALEQAFASYKEKYAEYNPSMSWESDKRAVIGFKVKGVSLDGAIELHPNKMDVELDVPFLFKPFQKKAIEIVEREVRVWIDKAEKGGV
ncbi:MAG TPA: polyhydroxyalkanoic acid system family protein [Polyangiaceae bacterium]|nr:polyhydroxyalkanoic acid system family protein [Polyangiaceae bacterium]